MKNINKISLVGLTLVLAICGCNENEALEKALEEKIPMVFERADKQFRTLMELTLQETEKAGEWRLPRTYEGGTNRFANVTWWTSGFFPGSMWYLYRMPKTDYRVCGKSRYWFYVVLLCGQCTAIDGRS